MSVKQDALKALDGMATIVRSEMLVHGDYVTGVEVPERKGAICGGRRACAVGSLWLGGGVRITRRGALPGVFGTYRSEYVAKRSDLRLALAALNLAAHEKASNLNIQRELDENGFPAERSYNDPASVDYIERFFEEDLPEYADAEDDIANNEERKIMLSVIRMAQNRIKSDKVTYRNKKINGVPDQLLGYTA